MMEKRIVLTLMALLVSSMLGGAERSLMVKCRYLNIPVSGTAEKHNLSFRVRGADDLDVQVRIALEGEDYWVFKDLSRYKGKRLNLSYDGPQEALNRLFQADTLVGQSALYKERLRPQYHFTTRRGWINDPNGLIWHNGQFHLFYQHNPYEREWGNMHWGHAVSLDLFHWEELDDALFPDNLGTIFSGSAVFDKDNTSGFGNAQNSPLVYAYTADGVKQTQCIAFSLDNGQTYIKYVGNPVIDSNERWQTHDTRDPRLFWYEPLKHWVMVLCEKDGHSIYTSTDLKDWVYRSHVRGFWECPDLFELPVDGDSSNTMWVMYGASGTYMLGDFDGYAFIPRAGKYHYTSGTLYAAQTYNDVPDGRRIQIGWGRLTIPDMPFNGQMLLPTELTLRTTRDGVRLFSEPVQEIQSLLTREFYSDVNMTSDQANAAISFFGGEDLLHIRTTIALSYSTSAGLDLGGQHLIDYDTNHNTLFGQFYRPEDPTTLELSADIYIDRTSVEVFIDDGRFSYSFVRKADSKRQYFKFWGREITIRNLQIDRVASVW